MSQPPHNIGEILDAELPNFGRWLLDWKPPVWLEVGGRFGFKAYHNKELHLESELNSDGAQFEELLHLFAKEAATETIWEGSATELHAAICANERLAKLLQNHSPVYVGRQLAKLQGRDYIQKLNRSSSRGWRIDLENLRAALKVVA